MDVLRRQAGLYRWRDNTWHAEHEAATYVPAAADDDADDDDWGDIPF